MKLIELTMVCTKCGARKNWLRFHKNKKCRLDRATECKTCSKKRGLKWQKENPEKNARKVRNWLKKNPEKAQAQNRRAAKWKKDNSERAKKYYQKWWKTYYKKNSEEIKKLSRKWTKENPERSRAYARKYRKEHIEEERESSRKWVLANPEKRKASARQCAAKRRTTLKVKLNDRMSSGIRRSLGDNKNGRRWETLVGYTLDRLKRHIEKLFTEDMTWEKFLKGEIHIDHKIPISVFNFESPEQIDFRRAWDLKNLQPLWKKDNLKKHAKIDKHFQPSLLI